MYSISGSGDVIKLGIGILIFNNDFVVYQGMMDIVGGEIVFGFDFVINMVS